MFGITNLIRNFAKNMAKTHANYRHKLNIFLAVTHSRAISGGGYSIHVRASHGDKSIRALTRFYVPEMANWDHADQKAHVMVGLSEDELKNANTALREAITACLAFWNEANPLESVAEYLTTTAILRTPEKRGPKLGQKYTERTRPNKPRRKPSEANATD